MSGAPMSASITRRLIASAREETRAWFEESARELGRWRGNDAERCRRAVHEGCADAREGPGAACADAEGRAEARYRAAVELMRSEFCDDKLAGMILFEERVLPDPAAAPVLFPAASPRADDADAPSAAVASSPGRADAAALARGDEIFSPPCAATFPVLRDVFDAFTDPAASGVHDWSTCDWMAAKVLGPYVAAHPRARDAARALLAWPASLDAPPWLRRVGLVAFVNLVDGEGDDGFDDDDDATTPRGGDALFGEGFVLELARACGAALGVGAIVSEKREEEERMGEVAAGEKEARAKRSVVRRDGGSDAWTAPGAVLDAAGPGERSDPTSDPEAWVRIGARWMLSLCAAECERVAKAETARTGRGRGGVGEDDENEKDAADEKDADAKAGAAPSPAKKPRSKRRRTARA